MDKIPNVPKHERALYGGGNNVEFCKCEKCLGIRKRRDSIFKNKFYLKILKLFRPSNV